jgi:hypothetical protein
MKILLGSLVCPFSPWRPADGRVFDIFAYDTETTEINHDQPDLTPDYVIGAACDGQRGVFISRDNVVPFFEVHQDVPLIAHNAAFDLRVTNVLLSKSFDIYEAVDANRVWDTQVLKRLYSLATAGHTARGEASLGECALRHLGVTLKKDELDTQGRSVRTGFGQFLGKPPSAIPVEYLTYLGQDVIATWHLFWWFNRQIRQVLQNAHTAYGYVSQEWLKEVIHRHGPLTHHIQLKASIVVDVLTANGIGIDLAHREEKLRSVQAVLERCKERMRQRGYRVDGDGSGKALQGILDRFHQKHPEIDLQRNPSGKGWSTAGEG